MVTTTEDRGRLNQMEEHLETFGGKLDEILTVLKGDNFGQHEGLVLEVKDLKSRTKKIEDKISRAIWISIGAGAAVGITVDKVWSLIGKITQH
jgi:hypothetical protein